MDQTLYLSAGAAVLALIAAVSSIAAFIQIGKIASQPFLTPEVLSALIRSECEVLRRTFDDNSGRARSELSSGLIKFQELILSSFNGLGSRAETSFAAFGARLDTGIGALEKRVDVIAQKLNDDLRTSALEASTHRDALRSTIEAKLDDAIVKQSAASQSLKGEIDSSFHRLKLTVTDALAQASEQQKERLNANTSALNVLVEKQELATDRLRTGVEARLDAIRQENSAKLDEMRQTVDERLQTTLETRLGESFTRVVEQLKSLHEGIGEMKRLAANVGDLQKVLTNVKVRGTYGEVQLELLLEEFLSAEQYVKNAAVRDNTGERVEFAIKLPGKDAGGTVLLPVDAKFPREDYDNLVAASEAGDSEAVALYRKQLENRIRSSAKEICEKYINPPRTTDFALLFIPTESLYAELLRQPGLLEYLQKTYRVTLASPTTFAALLSALQMGFKTLAIEKRSSEVWQVLGAVRTEFGRYDKIVQKISNQLGTASRSVDELKTRTRAVNRTLTSVESAPDEPTAANLLGVTLSIEEEDSELLKDNILISSEIEVPSALTNAGPTVG
ncbi:DNA recombination protein RmuC [Bradyrhizobium sp. DASA03005]|uniref:DNA recombination protein RmuC n=1 Tax=Bradyrhizobium sp. SPXBL-02 TaxID=3395912 RepID=UPI003F71B640